MPTIKISIFFVLLVSPWHDLITLENVIREDSQLSDQNSPIQLEVGDLEVSFIDNSAYGQSHRAGYNGISELRHVKQDSSIFVPFYAGFNLEHVFGGDSLSPLFEPRINEMELQKISDREVELHQKELPLSHIESWTNFKLAEPHYLDITFRYIIHSDVFFKHNYAGLFWASYIHAPSDISTNFLGRKTGEKIYKWIKAYSPQHGELSSHKQENDHYDMYSADNFNVTLASHYSNYKYKDPYYYGIFHNMVLAYLFDVPDNQILRFAQSPTGGGAHNPAWDFYVISPDFKVGKEYAFTVRMIYKKFEGSENIQKEYEKWDRSKNEISK